MTPWKTLLLATAVTTSCMLGTTAHAAFPDKPIRIVVPVAPGGTVDMVARLVAKGLSEDLGQPVIVENKAGASGLIGTREVARAAPDGYTLLAVANTFVSAPSFLPNAGYDPVKDFVPITQTCLIPMVLVANPSVPQKDVKSLIDRARAHPGEITFGSSGVGSTGYIAAQLFSRMADIKMLSVAYKGNSQALAVTTRTRSNLLPDVPTVAESGLPDYEDDTFNALLAPAGTPDAIVTQLHAAVKKVLARPDLVQQLAQQGIEVHPSPSPQSFHDYLKQAVVKYGTIASEQ